MYLRLFRTVAENAIQYAYGKNIGVTLEDRYQSGLRVQALERKVDEIHTMLCQQKVLIEHNSTRIDAQQKHLTTSELDSAERILKLNGIGEVFKCYDRD